MLSYRHGFHAGNPADVFKHTVLVALVRAMQHKEKGIRFIDTHAGSALYDLNSEPAQKNREFEHGIGKLWNADPGAGPLADYLQQVRAHNADGDLRFYPGSPLMLRNLLRRQDELVLCELHPSEQHVISKRFAEEKQVKVHVGDGYAALRRYLPPPTGRGLVLIDPSFEVKTETQDIEAALEVGLKRSGHSVYAIWYPVIEGRDTTLEAIPGALGLDGERWLELRIEFSTEQRLGRMTGCGMAIINCPHRARRSLVQLNGSLISPGSTRVESLRGS
jgi:23S rRNA (adenine2030-N6)-methyltransferase